MRGLPRLTLIVPAFLALTACGGLGIKNLTPQQAAGEMTAGLGTFSSPGDIEAEKLITLAAKESGRNHDLAVDLYLEAAERTIAGATGGGATAALYRHATGQAVALLNSPTSLARHRPAPKRYTVSYSNGGNLFDPSEFDQVVFSDTVIPKDIEITQQPGIGAPVTCIMDYSAERHAKYPFLHKIGICEPATALVEFPAPGQARISLCNLRKSDRISFRGKTCTLAGNFTVPLAESYDRQHTKNIGLVGMVNPASFLDEMGLYCMERMHPGKIPVVFSHGLNSKPATWIKTYNDLIGERWFRENYQVYGFYYPTGLPPMYPAAGLREELNRLHRELKAQGAGSNADRMVLVGHSMGGLMTSFQIRDFRGASGKLFKRPIGNLPIAPGSRKALSTLLENPPPYFVKRAVFVATPHRGSTIADNWIGRVTASLIRIPGQLLTLQLPSAAHSLTDLGQNIIPVGDPLVGVVRLKSGNPMLMFALEQPIAAWVPYHSIIGDRGKGGGTKQGDEPESSDGVVPYWSSHLEGARSEKIVPSGHSAHLNPEAIAELKRIFRLHLGK